MDQFAMKIIEYIILQVIVKLFVGKYFLRIEPL